MAVVSSCFISLRLSPSLILFSIFILQYLAISYHNIALCEATLASPFPFQLDLPDGTKSGNITIVGSPSYFAIQDELGYTLIKDPDTKFVFYAIVDPITGDIKPSKMKLSKNANPESIGIKKVRGEVLPKFYSAYNTYI